MADSVRLRDYRFDYLKALAISLVFLGHIIMNSFDDFSAFPLFHIIWAIQMPLFMFISGFFSTDSVPISRSEGIRRLKTRAVTYLVPFFSWFYLIRVLLLGAYHRNIADATVGLVNDVVVSFWYLWVVFILNAVFILGDIAAAKARTPFGKHFRFLIAAGILMMPWAVLCITVSTSFLGCKYILYYSIFFGIGFLLRKHKPLLSHLIKIRWLSYLCFSLCTLIFVGIIVTTPVYTESDNLNSIAIRLIAGFCSIITLGFLFRQTKSSANNKFQRLFACIGRNTLEIYVVHIILYQYILISPVSSADVGLLKTMLVFLVNTTTISALCLGIIILLKTNRYTRFVFFGRSK